jgi:hypothetical protein
MANFQTHLSVAAALGAGYGAAGAWYGHLDWGPVFLGAALTALGGMLPDLDSDSGVPVRELFGLAAVAVPILLFRRLERAGFSLEQTLAILAGLYLFIRYGMGHVFRRWTVHRGMFHSIPAMLIAGLAVYLMHHSADLETRLYLAGGVMLGFLSHLVLDELYAVNFMGVRIKLNKYAGSAMKFWSPSVLATGVTYVLLLGLGFVAWLDVSTQLAARNAPQPPAGASRGQILFPSSPHFQLTTAQDRVS